jgi:hypothetical protein
MYTDSTASNDSQVSDSTNQDAETTDQGSDDSGSTNQSTDDWGTSDGDQSDDQADGAGQNGDGGDDAGNQDGQWACQGDWGDSQADQGDQTGDGSGGEGYNGDTGDAGQGENYLADAQQGDSILDRVLEATVGRALHAYDEWREPSGTAYVMNDTTGLRTKYNPDGSVAEVTYVHPPRPAEPKPVVFKPHKGSY